MIQDRDDNIWAGLAIAGLAVYVVLVALALMLRVW